MNRRDSLKLLGGASALLVWPSLALAQTRAGIAIYDGRFAEGRAFGQTAGQAFDCQSDAASLWFSRFAGRNPVAIAGLTGAADAMILADCARREGLTFRGNATPASASYLVAWTITRKDTGAGPSRTPRTEQAA